MLQSLLGLLEASLSMTAVTGRTEPFCNAEQGRRRGVFPQHLPQTPSFISTPSSPCARKQFPILHWTKAPSFQGFACKMLLFISGLNEPSKCSSGICLQRHTRVHTNRLSVAAPQQCVSWCGPWATSEPLFTGGGACCI